MPINKTTFYIGEIIKIYGKITPVPQNRNIMLARWYKCPSQCPGEMCWWRTTDFWTTCDDNGYFEFNFTASIEEPDPGYCRITTSQEWSAMVRYQPIIGEPPVTFEQLGWTVINQPKPKLKTKLTLSAYVPNTNTPLTSGTAPLDVELRGILKDENDTPLNGKSVNIYMNNQLIATVTTAQVGAFIYRLTLRDPGTYTFYAEFTGDTNYEGC